MSTKLPLPERPPSEDDEFHQLFRALRHRLVVVTEDLDCRIRARLDESDGPRPTASLFEAMWSGVQQVSNIVTGILRPPMD